MQRHKVTIRIGSEEVGLWTNYDLESDILTPADEFSLRLAPLSREVWDLCAMDSEVSIQIDGTTVLSGIIGTRNASGDKQGGTSIDIGGRDKIGRLVDESMPLLGKLRDLSLLELAKKVADPWFSEVTLSNARNRDLVRGRRAGKAAAKSEPGIVSRKHAPKKVEPGETRWEVLEHFLREAKLLAWSSGDGRELVIAAPNYNQETQFRFLVPAATSSRRNQGNVMRWALAESLEERYSRITVTGASRGDSENYGRRVLKIQGVADDGPDDLGIGADFQRRKTLIMPDAEVSSIEEAEARAYAEQALRGAQGHVVTLTVSGHAQRRSSGEDPAIFAVDTMAEVEIESIGLRGRYILAKIRHGESKDSGQTSTITLLPEGTELAL